MAIKITKMSGSGNDFIIIDNRVPVLKQEEKLEFVQKICARKTSVGADGVIFVENSDKADFGWDFYNEDGSSAEMCGNGGRCVARYAFERNIAPRKMSFETIAGIITAEVHGVNVKIKLTKPFDWNQDVDVTVQGKDFRLDCVNTGVPHAIVYTDRAEDEDVRNVGRAIRSHERFAPAGTNVNFVQRKDDQSLKIRTYERGVEDETLACGTGIVASALLSARKNLVAPPVKVETQGGETLKVHFEKTDGPVEEVYLEGLTKTVFEGTLVEL